MIQIKAHSKVFGADETTRDSSKMIRLMQKLKEKRSKASQPGAEVPGCPLPVGASWCEVRLQNAAPYWMAVYADDDLVSKNICQKGYWEESDFSAFGVPGHMLDIGGNIGYLTFAFAASNWTVTSFEPMAPNLALMDATRCRNPKLAARIHLNRHGLGTKTEVCKMISPIDNIGDGFTRCTEDAATAIPLDESHFKEIGQFEVKRLDEVLVEQHVTAVDVVKIDVEGYEYQVFAGAPNFLAQFHPRLIKSEAWVKMVGGSGAAYLDMFATAGYKFFKDTRCSIPHDAKTDILTNGGTDTIICKST